MADCITRCRESAMRLWPPLRHGGIKPYRKYQPLSLKRRFIGKVTKHNDIFNKKMQCKRGIHTIGISDLTGLFSEISMSFVKINI